VTLLAEKLARFSVSPQGSDAPSGREILVVAELGDSLEEAFRIAKGRLDAGDVVRVIAPGITLRRTWPSWVPGAKNLTLTEWGAFQATSEFASTRTLQNDLEGWVRAMFGGRFGADRPERVFFIAACQRFFGRVVKAYPSARSIADTFPGSTAYCVGDGMCPILLAQFLERTGGHVEAPRPNPRRALWRARVLTQGAMAVAFSAGRMTAQYVGGEPTRRAIRAHRGRGPRKLPTTWVGLLPDWQRMNHHLLAGLALPETEGGGSLGVLLVGTLAPYERNEANPNRQDKGELWPGLGKLRERLSQCVIEQAVMPERPFAFAAATLRGASRSARVLWRVSGSAEISLTSATFSPPISDVIRWATIDVLRATLAEAAVKELLERVSMRGTTVLFVGGNNVAWAPVDRALRGAGVTTVDHSHGWGGDSWSAAYGSEAAVRLVWARPDIESAAGTGPRIVVAAMPARPQRPPRTHRARRVLLMTNYTYWASALDGFPGTLPFRVFQSEVVDVLARLRKERGEGVELRWRPHPSDDEAAVREDLARAEGVVLSRGTPLDDDLAWADVIIATMSTTALEAMLGGTPVFVHALPDVWGLPATSFVAPDRIFFHAEDGARLVGTWLDRYAEAPSNGLAAEARALVTLFGPEGTPVPMTSYFGRNATLPLPAS
jgi:hypothetical protein